MDAVIYLRVSTKEQAAKDQTAEGYSIPAQREACLRHIAERGWSLAGEFTDAGESARTADRPMLKALLRRVADGGIGAVVVHKIDRLARSIEDHVAIRAALRHAGVQLVSVTENIEETASGRLVEGIHALMAEFYSANLAGEIRKGMTQKAKMGGWPTKAPNRPGSGSPSRMARRRPFQQRRDRCAPPSAEVDLAWDRGVAAAGDLCGTLIETRASRARVSSSVAKVPFRHQQAVEFSGPTQEGVRIASL